MNTRAPLIASAPLAVSLVSGAAAIQMKIIRFMLAFSVAVVCTAPALGAQYSLIDLGLFNQTHYGYTTPLDINSSGAVAYSIGNNAVIYSAGTTVSLGSLGGSSSYASGINDSGVVVGLLSTQRAFSYQNGTITDLGILGNGPMASSGALSVNNSGQVVGHSTTGRLLQGRYVEYHAVQFGPSITDLGTLGGWYSVATSINAVGTIAGWSTTIAGSGSDSMRPFVYENGIMKNLGTLGGDGWTGTGSASALNDSGVVVGNSWLKNSFGHYVQHAFAYTDGKLIDIGTLAPEYFAAGSQALDINSNGQIVGTSSVAPNSKSHAFLFSDGVMKDLNSLVQIDGWEISSAESINDSGQITAIGWFGGEAHAVLLSPVPEPETYAMMLAGLGLVGFAARRRKLAQV